MPRHSRRVVMLVVITLVVLAATVSGLVLFARNVPQAPPTIYLAPQFLWAKEPNPVQVPIPITADNPGPMTHITAQHERGFGPFLRGSDLFTTADATGRQTLASVRDHMQRSGWKALFAPARTESYPSYGLYITFQAGQRYCYVLYHVAGLDQPQAFQALDIYFN